MRQTIGVWLRRARAAWPLWALAVVNKLFEDRWTATVNELLDTHLYALPEVVKALLAWTFADPANLVIALYGLVLIGGTIYDRIEGRARKRRRRKKAQATTSTPA